MRGEQRHGRDPDRDPQAAQDRLPRAALDQNFVELICKGHSASTFAVNSKDQQMNFQNRHLSLPVQ